MDKALLALVQPLLTQHEGRRNKLYKCTAGKQTIGIGHNIEDNGLPDSIIDALFEHDIETSESDCIKLFGEEIWANLSLRRKAALLDFVFNLGFSRASTFKQTILAIKNSLWQDAANGLRISRWAQQVGQRAVTIAAMVERG